MGSVEKRGWVKRGQGGNSEASNVLRTVAGGGRMRTRGNAEIARVHLKRLLGGVVEHVAFRDVKFDTGVAPVWFRM